METDISTPREALKALLEWLKTGLANVFRPSGQEAVPVSVPLDNPQGRQRKRGDRGRRAGGSALSEFGPAIFFLFIFAVFPVLDMIALCFGYLSCVTMNDLQLREAAKEPKSLATLQTGNVQQTIPQNYMNTVMGGFSGITDLPVTQVNYTPGTTAVYVQVSTTVTVRPFLTIPFFVKIPGLGEPATFTICNSRILESPRYAIQ